MNNRSKLTILWLMLITCLLSACSRQIKFEAPAIDPPADLIPAYVPEGFELVSGFQLAGQITFPETSPDAATPVARTGREMDFDLKSPNGNDIQGVYYRSKDHLILITRSYYPGGTLEFWRAAYAASRPGFGDCECAGLRPAPELFPARWPEVQEERTIGKTDVAVLKSPGGWITVFVRGDYLLTVESGLILADSGISLEENLKIVASLLDQ